MKGCKPKEVGPDGLIGLRKRFKLHPVVISAKRFEAIKGRARQDEKHAQLAAVEEERRYRQYLKDGNDLLVSLFTDPNTPKETKSQSTVQSKESQNVVKVVDTKVVNDRLRKERVIRAKNMLNQLKPGPRALRQALLLSEMIHQRSYNEALNREIENDARRQEEADEKLCPASLVPFGHATEEEEKELVVARNQAHAQAMREDIAQRARVRETERDQRVFEEQVDRAQYKCLQEKEEKAAKEKKAKRIVFYRKALRDCIEEKAQIAEHELICDAIDDRLNCVYTVASRNLDSRYGTHIKQIRQKQVEDREKRAQVVCRAQQMATKKLQDRQENLEDRYAFEVEVDDNRRKCEREVLASQRRAYQLVERDQDAEKLRRQRELQRFHVARRLKNAEANRFFDASQKRKSDKVKEDLRNVLFGQRDEFLERRRNELMNLAACNEDPYLEDDKQFFQQAVDVMEQSRNVGRPLYPIATAVKKYEQQNQLDMRPEGRLVKRSRLRDCCWPGYYSKAELAFRKYEQREECREEQVADRHQIYCNSVKIKKLGQVEKPYKPCVASCPINCFHRRGMPAIDSQDSFDYARHVCYNDPKPLGACPGPMQVVHNDPLDNSRKISQISMKLPPMPPVKERAPSITQKVMDIVHDWHGKASGTVAAKSSVNELSASPAPAKDAAPPPPPAKAIADPPPPPPVKADPQGQDRTTKAPTAINPRESFALPKSRPPLGPRAKRAAKKPSPPPTWDKMPAPIPNPTGTWGSGSLPQPAKPKPK
ncbi:hypothetical protein KR009_009519 [Drosophila setifemur]|nr:hypothetical protein KR009_009519 [Drosophila setifemur]